MKTIIHTYSYDTKEGDAAAYAALVARLANHPHRMHAIGEYYVPAWDGQTVELETKHLFSNQWNTAAGSLSEKGSRVFDWAEEAIFINGVERPHIKRGHWLEQTPEMVAIRQETATCGYCGHHHPTGAFAFCPDCLGSEYLKEGDLPLTRMLPVAETWSGKRAPLTPAELAERLPLFIHAQTYGNTERDRVRLAKQRVDINHKAELRIDQAKTERDGMIWLLDHGLKIDNVIFYSHTGRFGFGWRTKLSAAELAALQAAIGAEFAFPYDIETDDGRKLSAN